MSESPGRNTFKKCISTFYSVSLNGIHQDGNSCDQSDSSSSRKKQQNKELYSKIWKPVYISREVTTIVSAQQCVMKSEQAWSKITSNCQSACGDISFYVWDVTCDLNQLWGLLWSSAYSLPVSLQIFYFSEIFSEFHLGLVWFDRFSALRRAACGII